MIAGGAFGLVLLALRHELGAFARRWGRTLVNTLTLRRVAYERPEAGSVASGGIPFAAAIASRSCSSVVWRFSVVKRIDNDFAQAARRGRDIHRGGDDCVAADASARVFSSPSLESAFTQLEQPDQRGARGRAGGRGVPIAL